MATQWDETKPPQTDASVSKTSTQPGGPVSILLVDDRNDKLLAIESILEPLGQTIVKARSGKEALRQLLERDFAVILLDVMKMIGVCSVRGRLP